MSYIIRFVNAFLGTIGAIAVGIWTADNIKISVSRRSQRSESKAKT
jgi:hypothetical protein